MSHPPSAGLRHVALRVKNLSLMRKFYVDTLGYAVEWEPDPENLYLSSGADNLALHQVKGELGAGSLDHLGILVQRPEDVDAWARYLKSQGVSLRQDPKTHRDGARSIYFADPEQNVIQILYHPPISGK